MNILPYEITQELRTFYKATFDNRRHLTNGWDKFIFGFQRGGFKFQTRRAQQCWTDGIAYLEGLYNVGLLYYKTGDYDVYYNLNDIFLSFSSKCLMLDTLQGTILLNFVANQLFKYNKKYLWAVLLIKLLDASSLAMDISDITRMY